MDGERFDAIAKATAGTSRRAALRLLARGALGAVLGVRGPEAAGATHFGCRHFGKPCARGGQCCSGVCRGGRCRAHHASTCKAGTGYCTDYDAATRCSLNDTTGCECVETTGRAPFCADLNPGRFACLPCQRDRDCVEKHRFPNGSACVPTGPYCGGCPDLTGTLCVKPCGAA